MSDTDPAEAAALDRLEVALDRIAARIHSGAPDDRAELAARLDKLIAQIRAVLPDGAQHEA